MKRLLFAVLLGFGLIMPHVFDTSSPAKAPQKNYLEQEKPRLFGDKDLYENQNFSKNIDRLRSVDFKNSPKKSKKEVAVKKLNKKNVKSKKKLKRQTKANPKKDKKKKKKKKEGLEEEEEQVAENADDNTFSDEDEIDPSTEPIIYQTLTDPETSARLQLLQTDPSAVNFELFFEAYKSGEVDEGNFYLTLQTLMETRKKTLVTRSMDILSLVLSAKAFVLLSEEIDGDDSPLKKSEVADYLVIRNNYIESRKGLSALRGVIFFTDNDNAMLSAAKLLNEAAKRDLNTSIATNNARDRLETANRARNSIGDESSDQVDTQFYRNLYSTIVSQFPNFPSNADYTSEWQSLGNYLADQIGVENTGGGSRSRLAGGL